MQNDSDDDALFDILDDGDTERVVVRTPGGWSKVFCTYDRDQSFLV